jgi:DNA-binding MarR family transcriptional regulator
MKVTKVLTRFASAPEDEQELRRVGRALGDELPRHRLEVLRSFRGGLARVPVPGASYAAGYVAGLLDITAEYETHVRESADTQELTRAALREDWRGVLAMLAQGPKLPSELAAGLGKDRPSVTRMLKRLRAAGLVQVYSSDALDGRRRPHRLTVQGRRLLDSLAAAGSSALPADVASGITVAVGLFRHLLSHPASSADDLHAIARSALSDPEKASRAVGEWVEQCKQAGLLSQKEPASGLDPAPSHAHVGAHAGGHAEPAPAPFDDASWHRIPSILTELRKRDRHVPLYVRTNDMAWGAWAYALQNTDATGMSRTIVNGDILAQSIAPPAQRFDLIYDTPDAIAMDRDEPTMRAFWEQAREKFVVTAAAEDVPDGFIQLNLTPEKE